MRTAVYLLLTLCGFSVVFAHTSAFTPLSEDGIHDAKAPVIGVLQEPDEVFQKLPHDPNGNVDWMTALQKGNIEPRTDVTGKGRMASVDLDIVMKNTASMPHVLFRHKTHTKWLTCSNCHSEIFLPQVNGNFITMAGIMEGKHCGICHGKVAFPPLECERCHNVDSERAGLR